MKKASTKIIGKGMPISQSSNPRPKPHNVARFVAMFFAMTQIDWELDQTRRVGRKLTLDGVCS
jgi:hypothetical protein